MRIDYRCCIATLLILAAPAKADGEMSPESCKVVTASAENLSARIEEMYGSIGKGGSFRKLIPYMPEKARKSASDAEDAWSVAEAALNKYKLALDQFTNAIKDCD